VQNSNQHNNRKDIMTKKLKPEFQPGGSKRHEILDKAVRYIQDPRFGLQSDKKFFLLEQVGLTTTEYLEALNRASNGGLVKSALGD
jgi:hypothetical protein